MLRKFVYKFTHPITVNATKTAEDYKNDLLGYVISRDVKTQSDHINCVVTTPDDYDCGKEKLPLVVMLHGIGEVGDDFDLMMNNAYSNVLLGRDHQYHGARYVCLMPQCPGDTVWCSLIDELKEIIESVVKEYNIDEDRVSLTGASMGGYGTWGFAETYPEMLSAISPMCGGGMTANAAKLAALPIRCYHGESDSVVPVEKSKETAKAIIESGGKVDEYYYPGVDHGVWVNAMDSDMIEWLVSNKR